MKRISSILVLLSVYIINFHANAAPGDAAMGVKAGTLGAGVELTFEVANRINMRFGGNYFKLGSEVDVEGNDYDFDVKLNSFTALGDWFVTDSSFRVTVGLVLNNNSLNGVALPRNAYQIDDMIYTSSEVGTLDAKVDFKSIAPYLGVGWGNPLADDSDWSFFLDLGIIFAGKPSLDITSTGGTLSDDPILLENIAQLKQDFRDTDEINYLKFYPVISVGLNYRF
jgi:hypothetical protein